MTSFAVQQEIYQLQTLLAQRGEPVKFIQRTTLSGSNPAPNPPTTEGLVVDGATSLDATMISFRASILTGRLIAGDVFMVAGDTTAYVVSNQVISPPTTDTLVNVPFEPPLMRNAADGAAVTITPIAVLNVAAALVTHYPPALLNGDSILQTDRRVRVLASDLNEWTPQIGSQVYIASDNNTYQILNVKTVRDQGTIYAYFMQVRV